MTTRWLIVAASFWIAASPDPARAVDPAIRYVLTDLGPTGYYDRIFLNDFGQVAAGNLLWTPARRNGVIAAGMTRTTISQMVASDLAEDGTVFGARRAGSTSVDDGSLMVWTPAHPNSAAGSSVTTSVLGQMTSVGTGEGDVLWAVRTLAQPYDLKLERWRSGVGGFTRTPVNVSVPLGHFTSGLGVAQGKAFVSMSPLWPPSSPSAPDSLSTVDLITGEMTVLRAGTSSQDSGYATDMNASGTIVGGTRFSSFAQSMPLAWFKEASGYREHSLPLLPGQSRGQAFAVNRDGMIVGWNYGGAMSASVIWENDGTVVTKIRDHYEPHSTKDFRVGTPLAINSLGQMASRAILDDGNPNTFDSDRVVLLTPAVLGDADVDQDVDFDDLLTLAQHYGSTVGNTWFTGDFTGDGAVSFDDLLSLAQQYGRGTMMIRGDGVSSVSSFKADWTLAQAMVPEPLGASLVATLGLGARRRRRV